MKQLLIMSAILLITGSIMAQDKKMRQKIESARIAMISERLNLTPEQAQEFWPVYNEFTNKRKQLRQDFQNQKPDAPISELSEKERRQLVQNGIDLKQKELDLERQYSTKILDVISTQQMLSLRKAEGDFRKMLIDRMDNQRRQQMRQQQFRRDQQIKRERNN